jgi:hypothetical protein
MAAGADENLPPDVGLVSVRGIALACWQQWLSQRLVATSWE